MNKKIQQMLLTLGLASMTAVCSLAAARAEYPERPVHVIVSVSAGGGVDVMARLLAQRLSERLHQPFVVENRPGAGGIIGSKAVIAAAPDGYTLLYTPSSLSLTTVVHKKSPYDVKKDFTPIIDVAISPYVLVVNPSLSVHSLKEFIAYAKAHPGEITYTSAGIGTASHLAGELLQSMAGIQMLHVPNKSMNPALLDVMGGQVKAMFASVPAIMKESIRIRPIAMAEKRRSALLPDLPTIEESGLPGFEVANWAGLLGPAGLDPQIVKKLHDEIVAILTTPDMKERAKKLGYDLIESTPEEFAAQLQADVERWGAVVKKAGVSVQ
jgi:tripartite-type tricarboxylate transporter receptor subunit TctC